jgi:putative acetyltransferase
MLIRAATGSDNIGIDALLERSFPSDSEAKLVQQLRENGQITLSIVASDDEGRVIGCAQFSPVYLDGMDDSWQGLAPVAVASEYRCQGIAEKMVKEGLSTLVELGYPVCVVLGDPDYYSRFGFKSASSLHFRCQWDDIPDGIFQIVDLTGSALEGKSGLIKYSEEFSQL